MISARALRGGPVARAPLLDGVRLRGRECWLCDHPAAAPSIRTG